MARTPASLGGYEIQSVLGTGGTGTVYLAHNSSGLVALKVFDSGLAPPYDLNHPNIVPVYEHGLLPDGTRWLTMQYMSGGDADSELRAGRMPPARAVHIVGQVACALDHAHDRGVVHGDVKPSNFLLSDDGRALLADFAVSPIVRAAMVLTSAAYASPEVLRGKDLDARSDVYSLGCSLFRLLTGKPPFFDGGSKDEVVQAHLYRAAPEPTRFAPWLTVAMDDIIAKAMAKDPDERFQSARALAAATAAALHRGD
ncbi:serine/threonine-protein kinase [Mycobacterium sp. EPa45]|uniref:serine/threonine-protein kinase n=1 Tax=Mycobacterium sp. EPa45 TaxID=1545728 RepID=UPI000699EB5B|nr:serine/threonine-protein kinase [Mycobacterium sp. EPa45]